MYTFSFNDSYTHIHQTLTLKQLSRKNYFVQTTATLILEHKTREKNIKKCQMHNKHSNETMGGKIGSSQAN